MDIKEGIIAPLNIFWNVATINTDTCLKLAIPDAGQSGGARNRLPFLWKIV